MVTSWILSSLSKDLADNLQYVNDARELWQELEDRYDQTNGAKLYQLQKEINDLSQGNLDITGYYTKMKKLWEELNTLNIHAKCACKCTCGARENMHKAEQDRRLIQFLMGLNEVYTVVRGSILMMNPLPTIAQAFSNLIQEEKQREVKPSNHFSMDSAALNASGPGNNNFRTNYTQQRNNNTNSGYKGNQLNNRPRLFCDYCKGPGYTKEKYYKLHEFSQSFKFNKGRRIRGNVFGSSSEGAVMKDDGNGSQDQEQGRTMHSLTKEQYGQLLCILESFQGGGDKSTSTTINGGAENFAGISACSTHFDSNDHLCDSSSPNDDSWILDSGATNHMTYNKLLLTNIKILVYPYLVSLPNGYKVKVTLIGDVVLSPKFSLKKVLFVPSFKFNLISVHSLIVQLDCIVVFTKYVCILLQGPSLKRPLEIGKAKTGMYLYCSSNHNNGSTSSNSSSTFHPCLTSNKDEVHSAVNTSSSFSSSQLANTNKLVATIPVASTMITSSHSSDRSSSLPHSHHSVNSSSNKSDSCLSNVPSTTEHLLDRSIPRLVNENHHEVSLGNLTRSEPLSESDQISPQPTSFDDDSRLSQSPLGSQTSGTFLVTDSPSEHTHQNQSSSPNDSQNTQSFSFSTSVPKPHDNLLNALNSTSQHLMGTASHECEPSSYEEAAVKPAWQAAMNQEFQDLCNKLD
ncbi:PREDICTED: uncharacterized protein LOC109221753 [Nicotiana attenuata]|uniref:uncharacterized protein LOC109221753 n=1 Tax=Nicotiana attenuata TaxID=49451 RepID=UPI0009057999|nr:PREDICTED: uncharacterized protein LOC109221753 [Nicotiana attenuata]